jgi:hypothetical protein
LTRSLVKKQKAKKQSVTHIEQTQGAPARAAVLGTSIATATERDPGVAAASATLGDRRPRL